MESQVMENSANTKNWVMQYSGGREPEEGRAGLHSIAQGVLARYKKHRLQKMHQRELPEKKEEEEWDYWFNCLRPMTKPKQTWREK
jgi:hypothetical protein